MELFHKFIQKFVLGGYSKKVGKTYLGFPKAAPWILSGMLVLFFSNNMLIYSIGLLLLVIGFFGGFAYQRIFKKETLKYSEELKKKNK